MEIEKDTNFLKSFEYQADILLNQFNLTDSIQHQGDKGTAREECLKNFLLDNKLPKKFNIGHGQIVSINKEPSKSVDLIIYNEMEYVPLNYKFPIEIVSGGIEVKSHLSSEKLTEGLDNIASFKSLYEYTSQASLTTNPNNEIYDGPFGIVFGYALAQSAEENKPGNSLKSLKDNLKNWEINHDPKEWPNLIVVLNEGIIFHEQQGLPVIFNHQLNQECSIRINEYKKDTLAHFYLDLLRLCNVYNMQPLDLNKYFGKSIIPSFLSDILLGNVITNVQIVSNLPN